MIHGKVNVKITSMCESMNIEMEDVTLEEEDVKGINEAYILSQDFVHIQRCTC